MLREGCRNQGVNSVLKQIFETTLRLNIALHLEWVLSALNPADQPLREWSDADVMLAPNFWDKWKLSLAPTLLTSWPWTLTVSVIATTPLTQPLCPPG